MEQTVKSHPAENLLFMDKTLGEWKQLFHNRFTIDELHKIVKDGGKLHKMLIDIQLNEKS